MAVTASGNSIDVRLSHRRNAESLMIVILSGRVTACSALHPSNALEISGEPIVSLFGNDTVFREPQLANADVTYCTLLGMVTEVSELQFIKLHVRSDKSDCGSSKFCNASQ